MQKRARDLSFDSVTAAASRKDPGGQKEGPLAEGLRGSTKGEFDQIVNFYRARLPASVRSLMTMLVMHGVAVEFAALRCGALAARGHRPVIAVAIVEVVVNVTVETVRTVKPRTSADEDAAREPLRAVVAIRSAIVRGFFVVAVRTDRRWAYLHGNLGICPWAGSKQESSSNKRQRCKASAKFHYSLPLLVGVCHRKDWLYCLCPIANLRSGQTAFGQSVQ